MKLIITGATGYVGSEVVIQALRHPEITNVVAVARKAITPPAGTDASKLKSVVIKEYDSWPEEVTREFTGANACIWTVAITPAKSKMYEWEEVRRVCVGHPEAGLKAMITSDVAKPFRFVYLSGSGAERDKNKRPSNVAFWLNDYLHMRGEAENNILAFAAERKGELEAGTLKPSLIVSPGIKGSFAGAFMNTIGIGSITVQETAASCIEQALRGFEKEPVLNDDMVKIGRKALLERESK